jgi:hypothetical protein
MLCDMKAFGVASVCCTALILAAADDAFARGGGRSGGSSSRGSSGHAHSAGHAPSGHFAGHAGAHRGFRSHSRVFIGGTFIAAPVFFPAPYYYAPAPVYYDQPPVYIQQPETAPQSEQYWYYCAASRAYYPYVNECAGGWQRVLPNTQSPPAG